VRTTVTKIGFGAIAGAILTTMALGASSAADAAELSSAGQAYQYGQGFGGPGYGGQYFGGGQFGGGYGPAYGPQSGYRPAYPARQTAPTATRQTTVAAPATTSTTSAAGQVLAQLNRVRAGAGAKTLAMNTQLVASAHQHNLVMAGGCGLAHQCSGESDAGARISAQGLRWNTYAENIGYGGPVATTTTAQASMAVRITQSMIDEAAPNDGHRRNILNGSLGKVGIDVYRDAKGTVWITQDFSN
jgi:uncharacterized protein YkwD